MNHDLPHLGQAVARRGAQYWVHWAPKQLASSRHLRQRREGGIKGCCRCGRHKHSLWEWRSSSKPSRGVYFVGILKLFPPPSKVFPNFSMKIFRKNWKCSLLYDFYSIFSCFLPFYGFFVPLLSVFLPFFKVILLFHCFNWSILKVFPKYLDHLKLSPPGGWGGDSDKIYAPANIIMYRDNFY